MQRCGENRHRGSGYVGPRQRADPAAIRMQDAFDRFPPKSLRNMLVKTKLCTLIRSKWQNDIGARSRRPSGAATTPKIGEILKRRDATYRYIQFDVSRFGLPVSHSGAKVIQPGGAVNHVSASQSLAVPTHATQQLRNIGGPTYPPHQIRVHCK